MIIIENAATVGWEPAIRGMRNPFNSWAESDSSYSADGTYRVGKKDLELMMKLAKGGSDHAKYRRMINVYCDIIAPFYWWKEFDTYKVGTVSNSCSTMHKILDKEFTFDDFSVEDGVENINAAESTFEEIVLQLNRFRNVCLHSQKQDNSYKVYWKSLIQMLPSNYNQRRTIMLNYEVLHNIYCSRKGHKLSEWNDFCEWIEMMPYSEIITLKAKNE